jgi:hypothetical protein
MEDRRFKFGWAWIALALALAVHVTDEAWTDFLSVYNPTVLAIRERFPFLPLPTFSFKVWLSGLILGVLLLLALSPLAFRGARWLIIAAHLLSILMMVNALQHIAGSIYLGRFVPGVYSAPLLMICSVSLFISARNEWACLPRPD